MMLTKNKVIFLVGPTGVGKTQVGLQLSALMPVTFISADSMQIYKGMDIVTDKLPQAMRKKHPHHLVDVLSPDQEYNVADFCKAAQKYIDIVLDKKRVPVVIGGTGLYVNSLVYGIFQGASKDEALRKRLSDEVQEKGISFLYERLKDVDPEAAAVINKSDERRVIRALEVYEVAQRPISKLQKERKGLKDTHDVYLFGLRRPRPDLYNRIDQRVDFMINAGLLDEVKRLLEKPLSKTAHCCIGVREIEGFLKGSHDFNEAVRLIKRNSRHFAKRQMTWFNKNKDITWFDVKKDTDLQATAQAIHKNLSVIF